jgi:hypothetical protein
VAGSSTGAPVLSHLCRRSGHPRARGEDRPDRRRLRSEVLTLFEDAPHQLVYCEDPFGNLVEIFTHSHEQTFANRRTIAPAA